MYKPPNPVTQKNLLQIVPPNISPSKRAIEKYKPRGLFSEFYDSLRIHNQQCVVLLTTQTDYLITNMIDSRELLHLSDKNGHMK